MLGRIPSVWPSNEIIYQIQGKEGRIRQKTALLYCLRQVGDIWRLCEDSGQEGRQALLRNSNKRERSICQHIIIMMKPRTAIFRPNRLTATTCDRHHFSLRPRNDNLTHPQRLSLSFCTHQPHKANTPSKSGTVRSQLGCLECPVLNTDRSYASPTFILRSQTGYYQQQGNELRAQHEKKVKRCEEEKSELNLPKPKANNNYCSVCNLNYDDYLNHTTNPFHTDKVSKSPFNRHMQELIAKVSQLQPTQTLPQQQKLGSTVEISDSDEVEIIERVQKRVKGEDNQLTPSPLTLPPTIEPPGHAEQPAQSPPQSLLNWLAHSPMPSNCQINQLFTHQVAFSHYLGMFSRPFPIMSPFLSFPLFPIPMPILDPTPPNPKQPRAPSKPTYIVIDD